MALKLSVAALLFSGSLVGALPSAHQTAPARTAAPGPPGATRLECSRNAQKYPEPREALVIGNSAYSGSGWLALGEAPRNDARAMAQRHCNMGFSVSLALDLDKVQFRKVLAEFLDSGRPDVTRTRLFFYSGHGTERQGRNYLIPTDVSNDRLDRPNEAILLRDVFKALDPAPEGRIGIRKLVFLDSCRSDKGGFGSGGFLEPVEAPAGAFVSYATAPFATASAKGHGVHSRFTGTLLRNIGRPGESLSELLNRVRQEVYEESKHAQIPWESGSASAFQFVPALQIDPVAVRVPVADDLVVLTVNGQVAARKWREQASPEWISLDPRLLNPGDNQFIVDVYNDKTYRGFIQTPFNREGWHYRMAIKVRDAEVGCWEGRREIAEEGKDWGAMFPVLSGVLHVDRVEGTVTVRLVEPQTPCR